MRVEQHPKKFLVMKTQNNKGYKWYFNNVRLDNTNADEGDIEGTSTGGIYGVYFTNFYPGGTKIWDLAGAKMNKNTYANDITFN
ncbi:MAG: hypothetical protein H7Y07_15765 [Pyrinomonadaceae bacterium]|nr:hypothetical protein [Sphingobacteriaceae bacterium]